MCQSDVDTSQPVAARRIVRACARSARLLTDPSDPMVGFVHVGTSRAAVRGKDQGIQFCRRSLSVARITRKRCLACWL
jgi:hypothetical protein